MRLCWIIALSKLLDNHHLSRDARYQWKWATGGNLLRTFAPSGGQIYVQMTLWSLEKRSLFPTYFGNIPPPVDTVASGCLFCPSCLKVYPLCQYVEKCISKSAYFETMYFKNVFQKCKYFEKSILKVYPMFPKSA